MTNHPLSNQISNYPHWKPNVIKISKNKQSLKLYSSILATVDDQLLKLPSSTNTDSPPTPSTSETQTPPLDPKLLPADVRLNLLTGVPSEMTKSHSVTSSTNSVSSRPKDALSRINDLIKQSSVHDNDDQAADDAIHGNRRLSLPSTDEQALKEANSIQFYINETNKLTNNLENSIHNSTLNKTEPEKINITNLDDIDVQQVSQLLMNPLGTIYSHQLALFVEHS